MGPEWEKNPAVYNDNKEIDQQFEKKIISDKKQYHDIASLCLTRTLFSSSVNIKVRFVMKISYGKIHNF